MWSMSDAAWRSPLLYLILTVLASSLFGVVGATPLGKRADDGNELEKFREEVGDLFTETVGRFSPKGKLDLSKEDKRRLVWIIEGVNTAVKNGDLDESLYVIGDNNDPESETFKAAEKMAEQNSGETWTKLTGETTSKKLKARADGDDGADLGNPWNEGLNSVGRLLQKINLQQDKDNKVPKNERVGTKPSGPLQTAMDAVMRTRFVQKIIEIHTPTQEQIDTVNEIFALINENTRTRDQLWKAQLKTKFPRVFTKVWGELKEGELENAEKERTAALANFEEYSSHISGTIPDQKRRLLKMKNSIKGKLKEIFKMNDEMTIESPSGESVPVPEGYVPRKQPKRAASNPAIGRDTVFFRFDFEPAFVVSVDGESVFYDVDKNGKHTLSKNQKPPRPLSQMFADAAEGDTEVVPVDEGRLYDMSRKRFGKQPLKGQPLKFTEAENQAPPNPDNVGRSDPTDDEVKKMIKQNHENKRSGQRPQRVDPNDDSDGELADTEDSESDDPRRPKGGARRPPAKEPTGGKVHDPAKKPGGGSKRPPGTKPPPNRRPPPPPRTGGGKGGRG